MNVRTILRTDSCSIASVSFALLIVFGLAFTLFFSLPVRAEFRVDPRSLGFELVPGETRSKVLTFRNPGEEEAQIELRVADWSNTKEGNLRVLPPGSKERSCAEWLSPLPQSLTLEPDEERRLTVEVSVPKDMKGDYSAMILAKEQTKNPTQEGPITTRISIGYAIKILIQDPSGSAKESGEISNISLVGVKPLTLAVEFANTGNSYLLTEGSVELRDLQGNAVESFEVSKFPTLPGERRKIKVSADTKLKQGQYYVVAVFDYGGKYRIQGGRPIFLSMPLGASSGPPADLDGDGLYEDVNGDGKLTESDASVLALNLDSDAVKDAPSMFDFNDDGKVNYDDATALIGLIEEDG